MTDRLRALKACCRLVEGPTTLDTLSRELQTANGLHLIAHGNLCDNKAILVLEKANGSVAVVEEQELRVKFQQPRLRFAFLHSCKGSAGTVGLGPRLVEFGVPAVIAMQDFVPMADARRFASAFYAALIQEGAVDIAANAGRQAIFRRGSGANWSIPVLFCRLKDAQVWKADPVRAVVQKLARQYKSGRGVKHPFPLQAVLVRGGLAGLQNGVEDVAGPKRDLMEGSREALQPSEKIPRPYVVLLGYRGRAKSTHLQCLFADTALDTTDDKTPLPLVLSLADCVPEHGSPAATIAWAVDAAFRRENIRVAGLDAERFAEAMSNRPFLLLVDGDDEIGGLARADAIELLTRFQLNSPQAHRVLLTADSSTFDPGAPHPVYAVALIIQEMDPDRVSAYLKREWPCLEADLTSTRLFDLAGVPWLLGRMIATSRQGTRITSRADILERFVREALARLEGSAGARSRAEQVLSRMAWQMQATRQLSLPDAEVYRILSDVRGNRDFQLQQFLEELLKQSGLLVWSGNEGVRFAYPGLQWHYCAKYLNALPARERERYLEDITATLGRLSRVRWWEATLVVLAGLTEEPDALIRQILAGSALTEGDQVFIAARCVHEANGSRRTPGAGEVKAEVKADVVDQIVDTLVWRSRYDNVRYMVARQKAIRTLSLLADKRVIPHLLSLATRKVRSDWQGRKTYDYSGVRLAAVQALFAMQQATLEYIAQDPQVTKDERLLALLDAWLHLDVEKLSQLLAAHDARLSAVAAFALGTLPADQGATHLMSAALECLPQSGDDDVVWAITDTLALLDPVMVTEKVVGPLLDRDPWTTYLAYLIGRLGVATPEGPEVKFLLKVSCPATIFWWDARCAPTRHCSSYRAGPRPKPKSNNCAICAISSSETGSTRPRRATWFGVHPRPQ